MDGPSFGDVLERGPLRLRPMRRRDEREWRELRARNADWLRPWEATPPAGGEALGFGALVRLERRQRRERSALGLVMEVDGALAGRVVLAGIEWGAQRSAMLGYWIDRDLAGRALAPRAAAMICAHGFDLGLHRIELATRPDNSASRRVAQKLGFTSEGVRRRYLHVDGQWRDHEVFARIADEPRIGPFWDPGS
ncbi:GNAT family N-acetyltransferase [Demequina pelophila]|uniref:GNAT family N-acetyltransferase n=1 Tax=Demequina pelophila TaxID=1638984 RepID=UPI0007804F8D|nr:GNAT family protein [Demequina pelophila]